jgi:HlyD family secretion protein/epimerase transport system membrane fusion protein
VIGLTQHTRGGIVAPGAPILNIVSSSGATLIEAQMSPAEIDVVRPGLEAEVRLTAFAARNTPTLPGRVVYVSADRLLDRSRGHFYYTVHVMLDLDAIADISNAVELDELYPGMPVEVMVITGRQTLLDYFLKPINDSLAHAFRES